MKYGILEFRRLIRHLPIEDIIIIYLIRDDILLAIKDSCPEVIIGGRYP